jgi:hypothetical protein
MMSRFRRFRELEAGNIGVQDKDLKKMLLDSIRQNFGKQS